jgi:hypothetical protein
VTAVVERREALHRRALLLEYCTVGCNRQHGREAVAHRQVEFRNYWERLGRPLVQVRRAQADDRRRR